MCFNLKSVSFEILFHYFHLTLKKYKLISLWSKINSISKSFATFLVNDLETRN